MEPNVIKLSLKVLEQGRTQSHGTNNLCALVDDIPSHGYNPMSVVPTTVAGECVSTVLKCVSKLSSDWLN